MGEIYSPHPSTVGHDHVLCFDQRSIITRHDLWVGTLNALHGVVCPPELLPSPREEQVLGGCSHVSLASRRAQNLQPETKTSQPAAWNSPAQPRSIQPHSPVKPWARKIMPIVVSHWVLECLFCIIIEARADYYNDQNAPYRLTLAPHWDCMSASSMAGKEYWGKRGSPFTWTASFTWFFTFSK